MTRFRDHAADSRMLLIIIAGISLAIGVPILSNFLLKMNERRARTQLAVFRTSLSQYLSDNNQRYPETLETLITDHKYLSSIPLIAIPVRTPKASDPKYTELKFSHRGTSAIYYGEKPNDAGGWFYNNVPNTPDHGNVRINCTHSDLSGRIWASY